MISDIYDYSDYMKEAQSNKIDEAVEDLKYKFSHYLTHVIEIYANESKISDKLNNALFELASLCGMYEEMSVLDKLPTEKE